MANSINLIAFGTFGNPNGFKQTFFVGSKELSKSIKTFDLNTNAIKLFNKSKVYSIRKEYVNSLNTISYSIYTYAKEQNSDRSGTFIGSSILYTNRIAKENITLSLLNEFHHQIVTKNVSDDIISVNHSEKFSVVKPKDFDKIEFHFREIENLDFRQNTNNYLVVFCNVNENSLIRYFENSIDLLNVYDTVYFTDSQEVAEFVHQKGVFKLIQNVGDKKDFDKEIQSLNEDRKRIREQSIVEFEKEVQRINEERNRTIKEFKNQIENSERTHNDNAKRLKESRDEINKINQFYEDFINKTRGLINQLKNNNSKLEELKQIHNSNKILFNNGKSELKSPNYINTIIKPKPKGNLHTEPIHQDDNDFSINRARSSRESVKRSKLLRKYKISTFVLAFLLLNSWIYLLFIELSSQIKTESIQNQEEIINIPQEETQSQEELNPSPNSQLNENDYRIVAKNLKYGLKVEEVVKVIFDKNPTEIKNFYNSQENIYSKYLTDRNKECFEKKDGIFYFTKDTIRNIPSFNKE